ncbi:MAG: hypothetical protein ABJB22_07425 [Verrucomicrobiota bacterium]
MQRAIFFTLFFILAAAAQAQIQVGLKLRRLQYIAYEPVIATLTITNLAGRDVELRDAADQHWFGFEVTTGEGRTLGPMTKDAPEPPLTIETGKTVTRKINLTPIYPVHDFGTYHLRANVYFADLGKFFYSSTKVFQVTDARPIWQKTVGMPNGVGGGGNTRTFSLLSNRFPDHTSLYVRVENKESGVVYSTFSLGRSIASDDPQAEFDRANQLHVLHSAAPRSWAYSHIGLNGELLGRDVFMETKSRPHLRRTADGMIAVHGGMRESVIAQSPGKAAPKLSTRPAERPGDE